MKKLFFFLFLLGNLAYCQQELPNVVLKNLKSENVAITELREPGKLYLYAFWATWCSPCIQELESISDVYEDWKKDVKLEIIAVSVDDARTVKRVKPLVNGKGWDYNVLLDTNQDLKRKLSIANVPFLLVVKDGKIIFTQNGHSPGGENELLTKLKSF